MHAENIHFEQNFLSSEKENKDKDENLFLTPSVVCDYSLEMG